MPDWFVVNVADATALKHEQGSSWTAFEDPNDRFPELGINIRVLQPGQPNGMYHSESVQENFLVLSGECTAIIEGQERQLKAWDFVHCPAGTEHIFVGGGEGPCAILMVGVRNPNKQIRYPVNELAARYGASVPEPTSNPAEAYAGWARNFTPTKIPWPLSE